MFTRGVVSGSAADLLRAVCWDKMRHLFGQAQAEIGITLSIRTKAAGAPEIWQIR